MTPPHDQASDSAGAGHYEILLKGHLDGRWADWFDGLALSHQGDGTTLISGPVPDQAALHGLLHKVRDMGLPLVSVIRIESEPTTQTIPTARERPTTPQGDRT